MLVPCFSPTCCSYTPSLTSHRACKEPCHLPPPHSPLLPTPELLQRPDCNLCWRDGGDAAPAHRRRCLERITPWRHTGATSDEKSTQTQLRPQPTLKTTPTPPTPNTHLSSSHRRCHVSAGMSSCSTLAEFVCPTMNKTPSIFLHVRQSHHLKEGI